MRAARRLLFAALAVLATVWASAFAWLAWPSGSREEDLGAAMVGIGLFMAGHGIAVALGIVASVVATVALRRPDARTLGGYSTFAACAAAATLTGAYLAFFAGCWGG